MFRNLQGIIYILPITSQNMYSLTMSLIKNRDQFLTNKDYYEWKTMQNMDLHMYQAHLAIHTKL
jgi:hypothetical protein